MTAWDDRVLLVTETKSRLRGQDVEAFVAVLSEVRDYLPEADSRRVLGALATSTDETVIAAGENAGLIMIGLGTGLLQVLNRPGFTPRAF